MKICLISVEIFAWGKIGGFGRATRTIGRELVKRGHQVFAVVPRRAGQGRIEELDGIKVYGFSPSWPFEALSFFKQCDADVFHSCEPSFSSYLAMKAMPDRRHMVTFRDPRDSRDWWMEFTRPSLSHLQVAHNYLYENNVLVRRCIGRMDAVFTIGRYLVPKVTRMYDLKTDPEFLPTPVAVPERVVKAKEPTVCYLARLDRRKRPELFLELAPRFPRVRFLCIGKSRDMRWESYLRAKYDKCPNLKMLGFVDQFSSPKHSATLERSWVMTNCATREALPNSFIEATAHRCAILSSVDPDGFASHFGFHADRDNFEEGLQHLLEQDRWRDRGEKAYRYTKDNFEMDATMTRHVEIYRRLIERGGGGTTSSVSS